MVTRPYLILLVKPRFFSVFLGKIYNFMHFERRNAFQNALNHIPPPNKKLIKNM